MPDVELMKAGLDQVRLKTARSTVLRPLQWFTVIFVSGALLSVHVGAPSWLTIYFAILSGGMVGLAGYAYIYFVYKDPDALRTEPFLLSRMSLENERFAQNYDRTTLETVNEIQEITEFQDGHPILLDYEPDPTSVRLLINDMVFLSRRTQEPNFRIHGREVIIEAAHVKAAVASAVAKRSMMVEYRRYTQKVR